MRLLTSQRMITELLLLFLALLYVSTKEKIRDGAVEALE
jgi:hypothetical protein